MKRLSLVEDMPICTDSTTRPWLVETGACVLDRSFIAKDNIATAGGCFSAQYLATWFIYKSLGREAVADALSYVAPVGEQQSFIDRVLTVIEAGIADDNDSLEERNQKSSSDKF